jgi:hypothetical protein
MAGQIPTALRLLAQEREILTLLAQLAARQEAVMIAGDLRATEQCVEHAAALLQREARISQSLAGLVRSSEGVRTLLGSLPDQQREAGEGLLREVAGIADDLKTRAARLNVLAETGQERANFVCKTLARAMNGPSPYRAPGRGFNSGTVAAISRRA